jgi:UPF0716 protein FxsA
MLFRLFLLFSLVMLVELVLLVQIAQATSTTTTIVLVLATGVIGVWLARWQGWQTVRRIQRDLSEGKLPGDALLDGLMILIAGALLLTPGVLTDAVGFALLVPVIRRGIKRGMRRRLSTRIHMRGSQGPWQRPGEADPPFEHDKVIDARVIDAEKEPPQS